MNETRDAIKNFDVECMTTATKIINEFGTDKKAAEKAVNEAISVLKINGLYALFLYLQSKEDATYRKLSDGLYSFGRQENLWSGDNKLDGIKNTCTNLYNTFFAIDLLEQTLTYVRFQAKAMNEAPGVGTASSEISSENAAPSKDSK